jgi:hypothetical protein
LRAVPEQTVNDAAGQPAGQVSSARPWTRLQEAPRADVDGVRARVRPVCTEQGVPEKIEDPAIIANVVALAFEGLTTGRVVRADGFDRWHEHDRKVDVFLEPDCGTEPLDRWAASHDLADATELPTLVPFWLPSSGREVSVREALAREGRWNRVRFLVQPPARHSAPARPRRRGCPLGRPGRAAA